MDPKDDDLQAWIDSLANEARAGTYGPGNDFGAVIPGTMDMSKRPYVLNRDGSHSTVFSESGGKTDHDPQVLYPRVSPDGRFISSDEAYDRATKGGQNMGTYRNIDEAESGARAFHDYYDANPASRTTSVYSGVYPDELGAKAQPVTSTTVPADASRRAIAAWLQKMNGAKR